MFQRYFLKYQYQNVNQFDLWETLKEVILFFLTINKYFIIFTKKKEADEENKLKDFNITRIMSSWTKQKGHPVIHIKKINNTHLSVKQNRFVLDSNYPKDSLNEYLK